MFEKLLSSNYFVLVLFLGFLGLLIVGFLLFGLIYILLEHLQTVRRTKLEAALKQDMLGRGFSAEQIEQVIRASATPVPTKKISDNEYNLVEMLVGEGKSVEEIERILRACKVTPGEKVSDDEYNLVEKLVGEGKPVEDIERILRACKAVAETTSSPTKESIVALP